MSEYNDQPKITQMWNSILSEFIVGYPKDNHEHPTEDEFYMINKFLNSSKYEELMKIYLEEQIIYETLRTDTVNNKNKTVT